jgi:hypothetical protein
MSSTGSSSSIIAREKSAIQERYGRLKATLREAYRQTSTSRGETSLNPSQRAFWAPAVHQAYTELRAPVTTADRGKLHSRLYEAHFTIGHTIHSIEGLLAKK